MNPLALDSNQIDQDVIDKELKVMDMTAVTLCKENNLPIAVLNINDEKSLFDFINNKKIGTIVT